MIGPVPVLLTVRAELETEEPVTGTNPVGTR